METTPSGPRDGGDLSGRPLATWHNRWPWLIVILVGIGGLLFTAAGAATAEILGLDPVPSVLVQAAFVTVSALTALGIMLASRRTLADYGFRRATRKREVWWAIPLAVLPVLVLLSKGIAASGPLIAAYLVLTIAVAFNEEMWFRGLGMAALRRLGTRTTVLGTAVLFGVLHLGGVASGQPAGQIALQIAFAMLAGLVLAEIVSITGTLWIVIAWHFAHNFFSFIGAREGTRSFVGYAVITLVLLGYAIVLWRRLPVRVGQTEPGVG